MTGCTATLTTATIEPCPNDSSCYPDRRAPEHCGPLGHAMFHTITCWREDPSLCSRMHINAMQKRVEWTDDTPGARPHTPPLVTDAEIDAAHDAYRNIWDEPTHGRLGPAGIRELLEAAARARGDET